MAKAAKKHQHFEEFTKRRIGPDDRVIFDGRYLEYDKEYETGVFLKSCDDGKKFYEAFEWGTIELLRKRDRLEVEYDYFTERNALARAKDRKFITDLDPDIILRAKMVAEFLEAEVGITDLGFVVARSPDKIRKFRARFELENQGLIEEARAHRYKKERKRTDPFVGPRQFQRLIARFEGDHLEPTALDWRYEGRSNGNSSFTQAALAFAYQCIEEFHTEDETSFEDVHLEMVKKNKALPANERHAKLPSATTLWRMKRDMGDLVNEATRAHDKLRVEREYSFGRKGLQPERPLQIVEMDEHMVHLVTVLTKNGIWDYLHSDVQKKIKERDRIWLSVAFDAFSRSVVGMKGLLRKPDGEAAIATLAMVAQDKNQLAALVGAQTGWPQGGTPEAVHTDAGAGYISADFQAVAMMFTGRHAIPPSKHPHLRSRVERFFRTINQRYIHFFSGQTFSSILFKDKYDAEKHAHLTHQEIIDLLIRLIVDCYHNTVHRGIGMTPLQMWYRGSQLAKGGVKDIPSPAQYRAIFGSTLEYTIGTNGIEVAGNRYSSPQLSLINQRWKRAKLQVRINDQDLSAIAVKHRTQNKWIEVPAVFDGLKGVTLWEWEETIRYMVSKYGKRRDHDEEVVANAIKEVKAFAKHTRDRPWVVGHVSPKVVVKAIETNLAAQFGYTARQKYDDGVRHPEEETPAIPPESDASTSSAPPVETDEVVHQGGPGGKTFENTGFLSPKDRLLPPGQVPALSGDVEPPAAPRKPPTLASKAASPIQPSPAQATEKPERKRVGFSSKHRKED